MKKNLIYSLGNVLVTTLYPLIVFPYISRVFEVSSIGTYNYYNILFSYISLLVSFGISLYASREIGKDVGDIKKRNKITSELVSLNIFNLIISLVFIVIPVLYFVPSVDLPIASLFILLIIANAISVEWYFVAVENQKYIFFRNIFFKISSLFLIFYFVNADSDLYLYVLFVVGGLLLNAMINLIKLMMEIGKDFRFRLNFNHYLGLLSIFLVEITFRYFGMGDIAIIERFISREELGLLTFSLSIFTIIVSFLKIISTTLLPRASFLIASNNRKEFYILLNKTISLVFFISLPAILCLFFGGKLLILFFGGEKYLSSIPFLKLFCPLILLSALSNTFIFQVLYPMGKTKSIIFIYLIGIIFNIGLLLLLVPHYGASSLIISSIFCNVLIICVLLIVYKEEFSLEKIISKNVIKNIIAFIVSFTFIYIYMLSFDELLYEVFGIIIGLVIYMTVLLITRDEIIYYYIKNVINNED